MRSPESEALSILGLARRAGRVALGISAVRRALDAGEARIVITALDASATQLRKLGILGARSGVHVVEVADGAVLGAALGRGPLSAVAVLDRAFADRLAECFAGNERSQALTARAEERN